MKMSFVLSLVLGLGGYNVITTAQSAGAFAVTGPMIENPSSGHSATLLTNGEVLIAGGVGQYAGAGAQLYDPSSGTFAPAGKMVAPRIGHVAVALPDGKVLIAGGNGPWNSAARDVAPLLDSAEIYDPQTGTFTATGTMTTTGRCLKGVLLGNGKVLIVGGPKFLGDPPSAARAELYDPVAGTFTSSMGSHATIKQAGVNNDFACPASATLLPDGKVLIPWNEAEPELYDPASDTFSLAGKQYWEHGISTTSTLLLDGTVLFAGGNGPFDDDSGFGYSSAEVYDKSAQVFTVRPNMNTPHYDHTATLLPDGTVLIAGSQRSGLDGGSALASAELYDPITGAFSLISPMTSPRYGHTATLLPDGSVLMPAGRLRAL